MGVPNPQNISTLNSEIGSAEGQKAKLLEQRNKASEGLKGLNSAKDRIQNKINELIGQKNNVNLPQDVKDQIQSSIIELFNQKKAIQMNIARVKENISRINEALGGIKNAITLRKQALAQLAGRFAVNRNREAKSAKG